jgi:hypothetical protein
MCCLLSLPPDLPGVPTDDAGESYLSALRLTAPDAANLPPLYSFLPELLPPRVDGVDPLPPREEEGSGPRDAEPREANQSSSSGVSS